MDFTKQAKQHLEDALTLGYITLEDGTIKELKASEILSIAKYVVKEGLFIDQGVEPSSLPKEMFSKALEESYESEGD